MGVALPKPEPEPPVICECFPVENNETDSSGSSSSSGSDDEEIDPITIESESTGNNTYCICYNDTRNHTEWWTDYSNCEAYLNVTINGTDCFNNESEPINSTLCEQLNNTEWMSNYITCDKHWNKLWWETYANCEVYLNYTYSPDCNTTLNCTDELDTDNITTITTCVNVTTCTNRTEDGYVHPLLFLPLNIKI